METSGLLDLLLVLHDQIVQGGVVVLDLNIERCVQPDKSSQVPQSTPALGTAAPSRQSPLQKP